MRPSRRFRISLGDWVSGAIDPVDCQQFGFYPSAEDPRGDRRSSRQGPARRGWTSFPSPQWGCRCGYHGSWSPLDRRGFCRRLEGRPARRDWGLPRLDYWQGNALQIRQSTQLIVIRLRHRNIRGLQSYISRKSCCQKFGASHNSS